MPRSIYTKLTRRHRTIGGHTQLWLAPDHLMLLQSSRFSEDYKRFLFADIEAIVITERPTPVVLQVIAVLVSLAWIALSFAVNARFGKWTIAITGVIALIFAIADIARGTRCRCTLKTRVSSERLEPVSRMRIAAKFLAAVKPRIEAAQGSLAPEQIANTPAPAWESPAPEIIRAPSYLPEILGATMLISIGLLWASVHFPKQTDLPALFLNTLIAELVLWIVMLVRRKGRDPRVLVYAILGLAIIGIGYDVVTLATGIGGWYMTVLEKARNNDKSLTLMTFFPPGDRAQYIGMIWRAALGPLGLAAGIFERMRLPK